MTTSKITSKGQITVPKVVRETLALHPGDRMSFVIHENGTVTGATHSSTATATASPSD